MQEEKKENKMSAEAEVLVDELEGILMMELEEEDLEGVAGGEVPEQGNCGGCYCDPE